MCIPGESRLTKHGKSELGRNITLFFCWPVMFAVLVLTGQLTALTFALWVFWGFDRRSQDVRWRATMERLAEDEKNPQGD